MAAILVNSGEKRFVYLVVSYTGYTLHLAKNDFTVAADMDVGDMDEADFSNYNAVSLSGWSTPLTDGDGKAYSIADHVEFIKSGATGNDIYGWYITDNADSELISVEKFSNPVPMQTDDDSIMVLPKLKLWSAN